MTVTKEQLQAMCDEVMGKIEPEHLRPRVALSIHDDGYECRVSFSYCSILTVSPAGDVKAARDEFESLREHIIRNIQEGLKQWENR